MLLQAERAVAGLRDVTGGEYIPASAVAAWQAEHRALLGEQPSWLVLGLLRQDEAARQRRAWRVLTDPTDYVAGLNEAFVRNRLACDSEWFDGIERYPLTDEQRLAIVRDEDNNLVVSGAGTGKTSTMVGKVGYLLRHGLAAPEEIAVLAFARKAAGELAERLDDHLGVQVEVKTFHSLGNSIVAEVEGRKRSLSVLAEDSRARQKFISERVAGLLRDQSWRRDIIRFFTDLLYEEAPEKQAETPDEYYRRMREIGLHALRFAPTPSEAEHELRTLSDVKVKSVQEVQVGNWLTLHGIDWEYEPKYRHPTATVAHRQYQPDFYLPDHDVYIEHFGVQRDGSTAPGVNAELYLESMHWKRGLHRQHGTTLVESFSYDFTEGGFPERLRTKLAEHGVGTRPLTDGEIEALLDERNRVFSKFIELLASFLSLYKGNRTTTEQALARAYGERDRVFLGIFLEILGAYERRLAADDDIDFDDMIGRARDYVEDRSYRSPYRYVLMDEFQDISDNRLALVQALRRQIRGCRLFAVGDDWQSIFRFTGADVGLFTGFADVVGATATTPLGRTFRFHQGLADFSSTFVTRNPSQLSKTIESHRPAPPGGSVSVLFHGFGWDRTEAALHEALGDISERWSGDGLPTVFVLGRYRLRRAPGSKGPALDTGRFEALAQQGRSWGLDVRYSTIHSAKGREADYVIVVGNEAGRFGFPSEVADDPVLKMVLASPDGHPHGEERRLFYVAVTRARERAYLLAPSNNPSAFVQQVLEEAFEQHVTTAGEYAERHLCARCEGRTIRQQESRYDGHWWPCLNYPLCSGKLPRCPSCRSGGLVRMNDGSQASFACTDCGGRFPPCPRCSTGALVQRSGRHGPFLGCSEYRGDKSGCSYTSNL
ncbi:MAG: UvrD-helicase domain-containing protein [Myxococcota bacterium]